MVGIRIIWFGPGKADTEKAEREIAELIAAGWYIAGAGGAGEVGPNPSMPNMPSMGKGFVILQHDDAPEVKHPPLNV